MSPRLVHTVCYVCVVVFMCVQHSTTASALSNTARVIDSLKLVVQIIARTWGGFTFCESLKSLAHNFAFVILIFTTHDWKVHMLLTNDHYNAS